MGPTNTLFPMQSSAIHVSVYLTALATSQSEHQTLNNNKHSKAKQTLIFFSSAHASLGALISPILIIIIIIISVISRSIYLSVSSSNSYFIFSFYLSLENSNMVYTSGIRFPCVPSVYKSTQSSCCFNGDRRSSSLSFFLKKNSLSRTLSRSHFFILLALYFL